MKLIEFVEKYKGTAKFDVNSIVDGENKDVIVFMGSESGAVKDEIMNGEVTRYSVAAFVNNIPTINIVVKPEEKQPDVPGGETQSPDGSGTGETTGDE